MAVVFDTKEAMRVGNIRVQTHFMPGRERMLRMGADDLRSRGTKLSLIFVSPRDRETVRQRWELGQATNGALSLANAIRRTRGDRVEIVFADTPDHFSDRRHDLLTPIESTTLAHEISGYIPDPSSSWKWVDAAADLVGRYESSLRSVDVVGPVADSLPVLTAFESRHLLPFYTSANDYGAPLFDVAGNCRIPAYHHALVDLREQIPEVDKLWPVTDAQMALILNGYQSRYDQGVEFWRQRAERGATAVQIEMSAQHPLEFGREPGRELEERIQLMLDVYESLPDDVDKYLVCVGKVHLDKDIDEWNRGDGPVPLDYVSLGLATKIRILEAARQRNIQLDASKIVVLDRGVGNGEQEAEAGTRFSQTNPNIGRRIIIAGGAQAERKGLYAQYLKVPAELATTRFDPTSVHQKPAFEALYQVPLIGALPIAPELIGVRKAHAANRSAPLGVYADEVGMANETDPEAFLARAYEVVKERVTQMEQYVASLTGGVESLASGAGGKDLV